MARTPATLEDFESRFRRHLPRSNDLTLIVLKGHLLTEEILNALIDDHLLNPAALEKARLTFSHRLRLARALVPPGALDDLLDSAENLNTLRNRMAHHLDPPELQQLIAKFLRRLEDQETPVADFERESTAKRLRRAIAFLCGGLDGVREACAAFVSQRN